MSASVGADVCVGRCGCLRRSVRISASVDADGENKAKAEVNASAFVVVCSARALSNGCKSRVNPNSGNYIAKGKGVHREVKSERSRWQTSDLTYRNFIQGI
jgi:hypothetical protein